MRLLVATNNLGKQREFADLLADLSRVELVFTADIPELDGFDAIEEGNSFIEIACAKAKQYAALANMPVVADDSGLEVAALNNFPGTKSKRFIAGSDEQRVSALLAMLAPNQSRTARFVTAISLYDPTTDACQTFVGVVNGVLATEPRGEAGFGYDPIFIPDGYKQTFAELGMEIKNKISHRSQALQKFAQYLRSENDKPARI